MDASIAAPPPLYKDRKTGLVLFGVATIIAGGLIGLLMLLTILVTQFAPAKANVAPPPGVLGVAVVYGVVAVALVWLGVGSVMTRRWARALLAVWSWSWLVVGLISCAAFALFLPRFQESMRAAQAHSQPPVSAGAQAVMIGITLGMLGLVFVVLPLIWALFYSGRNVKATCEARDPVARWTDRCPPPVLAASLLVGLGALFILVMPASHDVAPFFGLLLTGLAGTLCYLCMAAVWGYGAWALYRLDRRGWWVIFLGMIFFGVSNVVTYARHDMGEVLALMGNSAAQLEQMRAMGFTGNSTITWMTGIFLLPGLGYLWYIRKFFGRVHDTTIKTTA